MNFQTMNKQRKFVLIAAAVGVISMFLPWISIFLALALMVCMAAEFWSFYVLL